MSASVDRLLFFVCLILLRLEDADGGECSWNGRVLNEGALTHGADPCHVCVCRQGQLECYWQQCGPAPQLCQVFDVENRCNPSLYLCEIPNELVEAKGRLITAWPLGGTISSKRTSRNRSRFNRFDSLSGNVRKLRRGSSRTILPAENVNRTRKALNLSSVTQSENSQSIYFSEANSVPGDFNSNKFSNILRKARKTNHFSSNENNISPPDPNAGHIKENFETIETNFTSSSIKNTHNKHITGRKQIFLRRPLRNKSLTDDLVGSKKEYDKESIGLISAKLSSNDKTVHVQEYGEVYKILGNSNRIEARPEEQTSSPISQVNIPLNHTTNIHLTPIMNFDYDIDEDIDLSLYAFPEFGRRLRRSVPVDAFDYDVVKHLDRTRKRRVARSTQGSRFQRKSVQVTDSCRLLGVTYHIGEVIGVASDHCMQCRCASQAMFCSPRCCFYNIRERALVQDPITARGLAQGPRRHPLHQYLQLTRARAV